MNGKEQPQAKMLAGDVTIYDVCCDTTTGAFKFKVKVNGWDTDWSVEQLTTKVNNANSTVQTVNSVTANGEIIGTDPNGYFTNSHDDSANATIMASVDICLTINGSLDTGRGCVVDEGGGSESGDSSEGVPDCDNSQDPVDPEDPEEPEDPEDPEGPGKPRKP